LGIMPTLKERLEEVMRAAHWEHADLVRVSKQSSSVVSQWLGKGSKEIKSIGKLDAAIYIERESGFSALWVAKGIGPKRAAMAAHTSSASSAAIAASLTAMPYSADQVLERMGMLLASVPIANRPALADVLRGWALDAGADDRRHVLLALISPLEKRQAGH
jgi:hypothetical protein